MQRKAVRAIVIRDHELLVMRRNKFGSEYYALVGGGIDLGEDSETALRREIQEETGLKVGKVQSVFVEDAGDPYGTQYIYYCEYLGGEPRLQPDSDEAKITQLGQNIYEPVWVALADLPKLPFLSESLKVAILEGIKKGFPTKPQTLAWKPTSVSS